MKSLYLAVLVTVCVLLSGCGTLNTYVAAQNAAAVKDTKAANDNLVRGIEESICEVPIGAVIRNSEFVPIAQAACLPAGANQNPVQLLQNMAQPNAQTLPAYQQNMNANPPPPITANTSALQTYVPKPGATKSAQKARPTPTITTPTAIPVPSTPMAPAQPAFGTLAPNPNFQAQPSSLLPSALPGQ